MKRNWETAKEEDFSSKLISVLVITKKKKKKIMSPHTRSLAISKAFSWCLYFKGNLTEGEDVALDL